MSTDSTHDNAPVANCAAPDAAHSERDFEPLPVAVERGRACGHCGAIAAGDASRCDACGAFLAGNRAAFKHGRYVDPSRPEIAALIERQRLEVVEALGGESELSPTIARVVASFAKVSVMEEAAFAEVLRGGLVTTRGNARAIVRIWRELDEAMVRRATLLGMERKAKRVPTLQEVMGE